MSEDLIVFDPGKTAFNYEYLHDWVSVQTAGSYQILDRVEKLDVGDLINLKTGEVKRRKTDV